jgi:zinc D-Ala-D-Ala carboxypeptidase
MQLTENFSLEELVASETATRCGINNTPPDRLLDNLMVLARGLERVREALGGLPIHINSGYRCERLNSSIGGAGNSRHVQGLAADIVCPRYGEPLAVCLAIAASGIRTDQIIHEFGKWCHVAFPAPGDAASNQLLTIASAAQGYQPGLNPVA